jgi:gamma-glutamyltranspeptidase
VEPSKYSGLTDGNGGDTIYLSVIDRDGNIVSLIQACILRSAAAWSRREPA